MYWLLTFIKSQIRPFDPASNQYRKEILKGFLILFGHFSQFHNVGETQSFEFSRFGERFCDVDCACFLSYFVHLNCLMHCLIPSISLLTWLQCVSWTPQILNGVHVFGHIFRPCIFFQFCNFSFSPPVLSLAVWILCKPHLISMSRLILMDLLL